MKRCLLAAALPLALSLPPPVAQAQQDDEFALPTYAGAYQPQNSDERGLWTMADEDERIMRDSDLVIRDPALNEYVRSVLCRSVGDDRCAAVRIYIVRAPQLNATMAPNGTMRVYSGTLLRVRSEAELASILGHEYAHFELRHSLNRYRSARTGTDIAAWAAVLGVAAATYGARTTQSDRELQIAIFGGIMNFQRSQEREADLMGFAYMTKSGYRPSAAAEVWRAAMNEDDQTAIDRGRRSNRYQNVAFFASHPTNLERADTLSAMANRVLGGDYEGRQRHDAAIAPHLTMLLADELGKNNFGGTDYIIQRLSNEDMSAPLLFARGELYRKRGNPRDLVSAVGFYQQALDLDPQIVEAWRGLGLAQMRSGNHAEGASALRTYLEQVPDVADAPMLRMMIGGQ